MNVFKNELKYNMEALNDNNNISIIQKYTYPNGNDGIASVI